MLQVNLKDLSLLTGWFDDDSTYQAGVAWPMSRTSGTENTAVVYIQIEPGRALREHTDSHEEILLVLEGTVEATVGGEKAEAGPGTLLQVPKMVPHGFRNTGSARATMVGFFPAAAIESTFPEPMMPLGSCKVDTPVMPTAESLTWNQIAAIIMAPAPGR